MYRVAIQFLAILLGLFVSFGAAPALTQATDLWGLIKKGGHLVFLRHANAPGVFEDPPGIDLKNCSLQRNLDEAGRAQARQIGDVFRKNGLRSVRLISSLFCRTIETAKLMNLGTVEEQPLLNYLNVDDKFKVEAYVTRATAYLKTVPTRRPTVFVTHISNIQMIADARASSGEMVVFRFDGGKIAVAGKIPPP